MLSEGESPAPVAEFFLHRRVGISLYRFLGFSRSAAPSICMQPFAFHSLLQARRISFAIDLQNPISALLPAAFLSPRGSLHLPRRTTLLLANCFWAPFGAEPPCAFSPRFPAAAPPFVRDAHNYSDIVDIHTSLC